MCFHFLLHQRSKLHKNVLPKIPIQAITLEIPLLKAKNKILIAPSAVLYNIFSPCLIMRYTIKYFIDLNYSCKINIQKSVANVKIRIHCRDLLDKDSFYVLLLKNKKQKFRRSITLIGKSKNKIYS